KGYGAFSTNRNFLDELPPTLKELAEERARVLRLKEAELQDMARRMDRVRKRAKSRARTQKAEVEKEMDRFQEDLKKKRELERKQKKRQKQEEQDVPRVPKLQTPKTEKSIVRAREDIVQIGMNFFKLLTGQDLDTGNLEASEIAA